MGGRRQGSVSLSAPERREAAKGPATMRGWTGAERDRFALGLMLYGEDIAPSGTRCCRAVHGAADRVLLPAARPPAHRRRCKFSSGRPRPSPPPPPPPPPPPRPRPRVLRVRRAVAAPACAAPPRPAARTRSAGAAAAHRRPTASRGAHGCAPPSGSAPCARRLRAAHEAALSAPHAACLACGGVRPLPLRRQPVAPLAPHARLPRALRRARRAARARPDRRRRRPARLPVVQQPRRPPLLGPGCPHGLLPLPRALPRPRVGRCPRQRRGPSFLRSARPGLGPAERWSRGAWSPCRSRDPSAVSPASEWRAKRNHLIYFDHQQL